MLLTSLAKIAAPCITQELFLFFLRASVSLW